MGKETFLIIIFCFVPVVSNAQLSLTIEIYELRNNRGYVHLELNNEDKEQVAGETIKISDNYGVILIKNLKPGKYAFKYFHDENNNEKLDTNWLGIPKEGFGFSNNPGMTFGPPSFEKTIFELIESKVIKCKPKYF